MKTTIEQIRFYVNLVNQLQELKNNCTIYFCRENGTNWIKTRGGNHILFSGTKKEVYSFVLGLARLLAY